MTENKGLPVWAWVGCGCLGAVGAIVALVLGVGFWGAYQVREFSERMADPEQRRAKALEVLGASEIPEGYHAVVSFSVPFVFDLAVLSDAPVDDSTVESRSFELGEKGFIYIRYPSIAANEPDLRDFLEGRSDDPHVLREQSVDVDLDERVSQGALSRDDDEVIWACHRGSVDSENAGNSPDGLVTLMLIDCDSDTRRRVGIWFGPDPAPEVPEEDLDVLTTVCDPAAIERFLQPIRPCS